jgi:hypothetical protein
VEDASTRATPARRTTAVVPRMTYHSFQDASATEPLVIDVNLPPGDFEREGRFFRNFFDYLDDCKKAGQDPSPFQPMVFLKSADKPLGLPVGFVASRLLQDVMAWWWRSILGYKSSYAEHCEEK